MVHDTTTPISTASPLTVEQPRPAAAATLLALMHAQGEVERLSEREQLLSSLLVSVNAVLWAIEWDTRRVLYVSPAYERVFGRVAGLLLTDYREWRNSIHPEDLDYAEQSLAQVLDKGVVEDREYRIVTTDGQIRWISDKCYINQQAEPGHPVIVVGMAEDITEKAVGVGVATPGHHRCVDPEQQPPAFL